MYTCVLKYISSMYRYSIHIFQYLLLNTTTKIELYTSGIMNGQKKFLKKEKVGSPGRLNRLTVQLLISV